MIGSWFGLYTTPYIQNLPITCFSLNFSQYKPTFAQTSQNLKNSKTYLISFTIPFLLSIKRRNRIPITTTHYLTFAPPTTTTTIPPPTTTTTTPPPTTTITTTTIPPTSTTTPPPTTTTTTTTSITTTTTTTAEPVIYLNNITFKFQNDYQKTIDKAGSKEEAEEEICEKCREELNIPIKDFHNCSISRGSIRVTFIMNQTSFFANHTIRKLNMMVREDLFQVVIAGDRLNTQPGSVVVDSAVQIESSDQQNTPPPPTSTNNDTDDDDDGDGSLIAIIILILIIILIIILVLILLWLIRKRKTISDEKVCNFLLLAFMRTLITSGSNTKQRPQRKD